MENARRRARKRTLKLVRRAGARRSLERERGGWLRMCPRRWKETGAGSILGYASGATGHRAAMLPPLCPDAWSSLGRSLPRCHSVKRPRAAIAILTGHQIASKVNFRLFTVFSLLDVNQDTTVLVTKKVIYAVLKSLARV